MNILLVMPRLVNRIGEGYNFPLGIPYVSAAIKQAGLNCICANLNHIEASVEEVIQEQVEKNGIDAVFVGGTSGQYYPIKVVVDAARSIKKDMFILCGGGIITADPISAMKALENVDVGVIGEGEITDVEVAKAVRDNIPLSTIPGIVFKENDEFIITPPRPEIDDIDDIPWPDYDGFEFEKTLESNAAVAGVNSVRSIAMLASRSCPFSCSFCFHTVGRKYRQRSLDGFFEEFDYNYKKYGIEYLFIEDELFTFNNDRVIEFCKRIKKYNIHWWAQLRVDSVDPKLIEIMKDAGCDNFALGLESADNTVLKSMGKHITVEQIEATLSAVYKAQISSEGSFIFGEESETYETAMNTLNWWKNHIQYRVTLGTITVFPGSKLYSSAIRRGIITDPVQYLKDGCPQINVTQMSDSQFADITEKVMRWPVENTDSFSDAKDVVLDKLYSRVDFTAKCSRCGKPNRYEKIKLFMHAPLSCPHCGKKHSFLVPVSLYEKMNQNVAGLYEKYGKIAFWGVNYQTYNLIGVIKNLESDSAVFVDSSYMKQKLIVSGKQIESPKIIEKENITTVVVCIPTHYAEIELQIKYQYPMVERIIDIGALVE
ncbi:Radical SAM superfamily enzyme YgiQ, UPF0313 family [Butyrivibrio sp. ob235]|uniref:B12-binding domain-containing radical SAM protein n=1 Tax=Butyrivibrio sp. ob235 TaxID=1761780 RepID=UPI0008B88BD4|nr:radical SAM protein [Butyrivibrio sp. ob235]SEM24679.1 Radical SAM superfamily enzyme YgiQ, UPF0313 family [Butyrivibrio sp. ob235]